MGIRQWYECARHKDKTVFILLLVLLIVTLSVLGRADYFRDDRHSIQQLLFGYGYSSMGYAEMNCHDDFDNDADGLTDCDDVEDCSDKPECQNPPLIEVQCDDDFDNDADGLTDCDDVEDCSDKPECQDE